jgi:hypothetical protein
MFPRFSPTLSAKLARAVALGLVSTVAFVPGRAQPQQGLKVEDQEQIPDKEKLSRARSDVEHMQGLLKEVLQRLEEARREKDVVKLNCVNEKLTQMKGLVRVAEQSDIGLQESIAKGEEENAKHEYAKVDLANQRAVQLRSDAEQCIGQLAYVVDEKTLVTVEVPEGIPEPDTNPPSLLTGLNPPILSPTQ